MCCSVFSSLRVCLIVQSGYFWRWKCFALFCSVLQCFAVCSSTPRGCLTVHVQWLFLTWNESGTSNSIYSASSCSRFSKASQNLCCSFENSVHSILSLLSVTWYIIRRWVAIQQSKQITSTCCHTLLHAATRCNLLPCGSPAEAHCSTLHQTAALYCNEFQNLRNLAEQATHCNTLQHTATNCNTLQHIVPHCNRLRLLLPAAANDKVGFSARLDDWDICKQIELYLLSILNVE